jgi:hypothetical protein
MMAGITVHRPENGYGLGVALLERIDEGSVVCPEHIKITDNGIIPLKERVIGSQASTRLRDCLCSLSLFRFTRREAIRRSSFPQPS